MSFDYYLYQNKEFPNEYENKNYPLYYKKISFLNFFVKKEKFKFSTFLMRFYFWIIAFINLL